MSFRVRLQKAEALGPVNRWYCSQAHGQPIDDPDVLMTYFIKTGGAADFAERYAAAMDSLNRWYCSEFYRRPVNEPELLWDYFMNWDKLVFETDRSRLAASVERAG